VTIDDHLALHGIDLIELCRKYGTPLFVFDEDCLIGDFERFRQAFTSNYPNSIVCYSIKTNNNLAICKLMRSKGAYAEVASRLDLYVADRAGFSGDHIIFDGLYKPEDVLREALEKEVLLINAESSAEIERLDKIAVEMGMEQSVGLRINMSRSVGALLGNPRKLIDGFLVATSQRNLPWLHPHRRFGFSLDDAYSVFERCAEFKNLSFEGVMTHPYRGAVEVLLPFIQRVHAKLGIDIRYLNVGGGFDPGTTTRVDFADFVLDLLRQKLGLRSVLDEKPTRIVDIESVAKAVTDKVKRGVGDLHEPTIITEPGQFIVGSSGTLLLRVDHTKIAGGHNWVIVDGGTNIYPEADIHKRREVVVANKVTQPREEMVNISGPLLYSDDNLALKTSLPKIDEEDIIAVFDCGAYNLSKSTQFLHPRPTAVLLNARKQVRVIRERETCEEVLRKDVPA